MKAQLQRVRTFLQQAAASDDKIASDVTTAASEMIILALTKQQIAAQLPSSSA
jgi:hypothetical protein